MFFSEGTMFLAEFLLEKTLRISLAETNHQLNQQSRLTAIHKSVPSPRNQNKHLLEERQYYFRFASWQEALC